MQWKIFGYLLTFVLVSHVSLAAPYTDVDDLDEEEVQEQNFEKPQFDEKNLVPAKVKPLKEKKVTHKKGQFDPESYYYPYTQSLSPRAGLLFNMKELSNSSGVGYILGVNYTFPSFYSPHWEVGVDLSSESDGHFTFGKKWTLNEKGSYRPFYKLSLLHKWDPDERLASWTNHENYLVMGSVGLEDMIKPPKSARLELEVAVGVEDILMLLVVGGSWGF